MRTVAVSVTVSPHWLAHCRQRCRQRCRQSSLAGALPSDAYRCRQHCRQPTLAGALPSALPPAPIDWRVAVRCVPLPSAVPLAVPSAVPAALPNHNTLPDPKSDLVPQSNRPNRLYARVHTSTRERKLNLDKTMQSRQPSSN